MALISWDFYISLLRSSASSPQSSFESVATSHPLSSEPPPSRMLTLIQFLRTDMFNTSLQILL